MAIQQPGNWIACVSVCHIYFRLRNKLMLAGSNVVLLTFGHLSAPNLIVSLSQDEAIPNQPPASSNEPLSTPQFSIPSQPDVQVVLHVTYTCSLHQQAFNRHAFILCSWRIVQILVDIILHSFCCKRQQVRSC